MTIPSGEHTPPRGTIDSPLPPSSMIITTKTKRDPIGGGMRISKTRARTAKKPVANSSARPGGKLKIKPVSKCRQRQPDFEQDEEEEEEIEVD